MLIYDIKKLFFVFHFEQKLGFFCNTLFMKLIKKPWQSPNILVSQQIDKLT